MRLLKARLFLMAAVVIFTLLPLSASARQDTTKTDPSAKGQMKEGGKEMGKAGKSLAGNVKRGRILRGGKHFGKHMGRGGKHIAHGTKKVVKKAVKP